jgi:uncharacterized membrane protein
MTVLYLGIILFAVPHLFSIFLPAQRDALESRLGETAWKGIYSIVSLVGLVLLIVGYWKSRAGPLAADLVYIPAEWTRHATMLLVLIAFILLGASHGKGYLKKWLHNPMSLGIAFWATGHLLANGTRTEVWLFGTFLVVAVSDIVMSEIRGKRPAHKPRLRSDIIAVIAGVVLYLVFLFGFHPYILNIPVVQ